MASDGRNERPQGRYDVAILGGGLAGLSLGLQLKRTRPETSIFTAEKRKGPAPEAAFKVGESSLEIGAHYFARVLGLEDHIDRDQYPKNGVRFWFPGNGNTDITKRAEYGPPFRSRLPSYQFDRGRLENELGARNHAAGVELFDGCVIEEVALGSGGDEHRITASRDGESFTLSARWVVDAAGRAALLKIQLGLQKETPHDINAAWFRLSGKLDLEEWGADDEEFLGRMSERGLRWLSTNHLLNDGYWVWLIPLATGNTSIGIVADPRFHPYDEINSMEKAMAWLHEHEPQLAEVIEERRDDVQDFLRVQHYSHGCTRVYSPDRWCVTGDAGVFADPLFSPGSDFISISNSLITDLVEADLAGRPVQERVERANDFYLRYFEAWLKHYQDAYALFGNPVGGILKFSTYRATYFGIPLLLFYSDKLCDGDFMPKIADEMDRFMRLVPRLESLVREWNVLERRSAPGVLLKPIESNATLPIVGGLLTDARDPSKPRLDDDAMKAKIGELLALLEAAAIFLMDNAVRYNMPEYALDPETKVNPYAISLRPEAWEEEGLFDGSGITIAQARQMSEGMESRLEELRSICAPVPT